MFREWLQRRVRYPRIVFAARMVRCPQHDRLRSLEPAAHAATTVAPLFTLPRDPSAHWLLPPRPVAAAEGLVRSHGRARHRSAAGRMRSGQNDTADAGVS